MTRSLSIRSACLLFVLILSYGSKAAESNLIVTQQGDCPVLLTAPHGGTSEVPGVSVRRGEGVSKFKTLRDTRTDELTEKIAKELERQGYGRPYVVIAKFHRRYIDANRPADGAFESTAAELHYNAYHEAVQLARREITKRWGRGVLLDFHGTAAEPSTIYRGTQNGDTVSHLTNRFGVEALRGSNSLFGQIAANGIAVAPAVGSELPENPRLNGGFTVRSYGSNDGGAFDAIQLEFGAKLRDRSNIDRTAQLLAKSVAAFASDFLPSKESKQRATADGIGLLVPAYSYPAGAGLEFWNALIDVADRVPIIVIANPNSGPGNTQDANYAKIIERSQAAGIRVVGYVATGYSKRDLADVRRDVDQWKALYPSIEGIFFDEQSSDAKDIDFYAAASDHAREAIPNALVVSNPGTMCDDAYFSGEASDVVCVFENSKGYNTFVAPTRKDSTKSAKFAGLLHSQATATVALSSVRQAAKKNLSYVFITDDTMPNPWDRLPSYWASEVEAIEMINASGK